MPTIRIVRAHRLPHEQILAEAEALAAELKQKLHARCHWEGETLRFDRTGAHGSIEVGPDSVAIEVHLSLALSPLRSRVERAVNDYLDRHLA